MDKQQIKEEVGKLNLVVTEFEADGMCYMDSAVSVTQVYDLIDQLDGTEVLSKEWINKHITDGHNVTLGEKVVYADELDGVLVPNQELPVIPQFIADWIEEIKPDNSLRVAFEYIAQRKADNHDDPIALWVEEGNSETFARAWMDGYKVEEG